MPAAWRTTPRPWASTATRCAARLRAARRSSTARTCCWVTIRARSPRCARVAGHRRRPPSHSGTGTPASGSPRRSPPITHSRSGTPLDRETDGKPVKGLRTFAAVVTLLVTAALLPAAAGAATCPCSLYADTNTPFGGILDNPVSLGVKFTSDQDGYITALRIFRPTGASGDRVAHLWAA